MDKLTEGKLLSFLKKEFPQLIPESRLTGFKKPAAGPHYDFSFTLRLGRLKKRIICENLISGEPKFLYQAIGQVTQIQKSQKQPCYPLIVAPYISKEGRKICSEAGVGFIDTCGNVYLKFNTVLIEKESKQGPKQQRKATERTVFSRKSSRIIRVVLENPKKNWTLQTLSDEAGLYIRQTWVVINVLAEKGFVEKKRGSITLAKPKELLDYWAGNYDFDLNQISTLFSFARTFDEFLQKLRVTLKNEKLPCALTRHSGAALVAPYVRFSNTHLYILGETQLWQERLGLRPVERGGTVHLLKPYDEGIFYHLQKIDGVPVVSNTQLYLDLITYPARGKEQADFLRKEKIGF